MPLWVRVSATEYMEWTGSESWDLDSTVRLAKLLPDAGVDVLDVSSGGNNPKQRIPINKHLQVDFARSIREAVRAEGKDLKICAVGWITEAERAKSVVEDAKVVNGDVGSGQGQGATDTIELQGDHGTKASADIVMAAKQFLREAEWPLKVAHELGVEVSWPNQYHRVNPPLIRKEKGKI